MQLTVVNCSLKAGDWQVLCEVYITIIQKPPEIQLPSQVLESALWWWSNEKARTEGTDGTRAVMSKLKDRGLEVLVRREHLWNNSKWCRWSSETGILDCDPGKESSWKRYCVTHHKLKEALSNRGLQEHRITFRTFWPFWNRATVRYTIHCV